MSAVVPIGGMSRGSSSQRLLAQVFLAHIPQDRRQSAAREIASSLKDSDSSDTAAFVAHVLEQDPDDTAESLLRSFLLGKLEKGQIQPVTACCAHSIKVRDWLLLTVTEQVEQLASFLLYAGQIEHLIVSIQDLSFLTKDVQAQPGTQQEVLDATRAAAQSLSLFTSLLRSVDSFELLPVPQSLLKHVILSLFAADERLFDASRSAIFAFLQLLRGSKAEQDCLGMLEPVSLDECIWQCVKLLLSHGKSSIYPSAGYQIWLRLLDTGASSGPLTTAMNTDEYWDLIQKALAYGDVEHRKAALHILRISIAISRDIRLDVCTTDMILSSDAAPKGTC